MSDNPGKKQCRVDGQDPYECRGTQRTFPDPVLFRNDYGCVGLQDKGSISVGHFIYIYIRMILYCVAPEERRWKRN